MQIRGEFNEKTILNAQAIRDTNPVTTDKVNLQGIGKKSLIVYNGLNQNVTVQIQGCHTENGTYVNVGTAQTVNTGTNTILGENEVVQLKNYFPYLQAIVTAAVAPTTGTCTVVAVKSF